MWANVNDQHLQLQEEEHRAQAPQLVHPTRDQPWGEVTTQVSTVTDPASARQAMEMVRAGMRFLANGDATEMAVEVQAQCLRVLEQVNAMGTAARAFTLNAFTANKGYSADAAHSQKSWLIHRTRITKGAATSYAAWARRATAHPEVVAALAAGDIVSESYARTICVWSDKLPTECRPAADNILIAAAKAGADLRGLAELAAEIYARSLPDTPDDHPGQTFEDRSVRLETTFEGAGVMTADLTPECAAVVTAVLDALSAPMGAEDHRSHQQRYHDALQEAMRRLVAGGLLPERAGQPVKVLVHMSLKDLLDLDAGSALLQEWTERLRGRWAAARAAASVSGSDGGAWLEGDAANAMACDASLTPVVTGDVNPAALDELVRLCVELARLRHDGGEKGGPSPAWETVEQAIIGQAVDLLSGPGGLASFLRRRELGVRLGGPSMPLDIGMSENVPAGIRNAVLLRDRHCQWPGGCNQPAAACEVHHVRHKKHGGQTSLGNCVLLCFFHHQVVIHQLGWTLVLNPDGTTTAWSPDKAKVYRSHSPPDRLG
jgi:hypothetical protein